MDKNYIKFYFQKAFHSYFFFIIKLPTYFIIYLFPYYYFCITLFLIASLSGINAPLLKFYFEAIFELVVLTTEAGTLEMGFYFYT